MQWKQSALKTTQRTTLEFDQSNQPASLSITLGLFYWIYREKYFPSNYVKVNLIKWKKASQAHSVSKICEEFGDNLTKNLKK